MKNKKNDYNVKVNHNSKEIIIGCAFAKLAESRSNNEYRVLREIHNDYPTYEITVRSIQKNHNKNTYSGLTYDYMKSYISKYEPIETRGAVLFELNQMMDISLCHNKSRRYPTIKKWFLEKYPKIAEFGALVPIDEEIEDEELEEKAFAESALVEFPKAS